MKKRLLVVDDDVRLTRIVALTAETLGIATRQVNEPTAALDAFLEFQPNTVMIDIMMPEQDGIDVLNEILLTGIPARLVLTSGFGEEMLAVAQDAVRFHGGAAAVLAKPFQRSELVAMLDAAFDRAAKV